ncbi:hypothetical protein IPH92_03100 [Candidatus Kaiserbacteria bacterium]|nr:MAG: hypothetical protein IPH92_03100 [Candidatus Kaiserbacteria bacterium]
MGNMNTSDGLDFFSVFRVLFENVFGGNWNVLVDTASFWWNIYSLLALLVSLLFFAGFVYAQIQYGELSAEEQTALRAAEKAWAAQHDAPETKNARWDAIQVKIADHNPESWRIAIIEADIMLEETLTNAGYVGQGIGQKLKSANTTSFTTLQDAWEAHKIRNEIAHVGSDFVLTQRSAQDTLMRFERVFREFGVV